MCVLLHSFLHCYSYHFRPSVFDDWLSTRIWRTMLGPSHIVIVLLLLSECTIHAVELNHPDKTCGSSSMNVSADAIHPQVDAAHVDWIKITSGEELSLVVGSVSTVNLLVGARDGSTFESSQYKYMNLCLHIHDDIVKLVYGEDLSSHSDRTASSFTLYARSAGVTTFYVSARQQSGREIYSQTIKVEVYTPPLVHPHDIFLAPGASIVLTVKGGPTLGVVEYMNMNDSVVVVQQLSGRISAISPGNATILATFYGNGREVLCEAHVKVKVGVPSAAMLNVQSKQLAVGRETPIFPVFYEGNLFSFFEVCNNYRWTIENKVLSFQPAVPPPQHDIDFIKVLFGRYVGRSNVTLTFSCNFSSSSSFSQWKSYSASCSLRVVANLSPALGIPLTWILPPHYLTSDLLPACSTVSYSPLMDSVPKYHETHQGAIFIDGNKIRTSESNSLACIQAKDLETGRIDIASCVRVAEVYQVRIRRLSASHVINVVVGAEIELQIDYYDHTGNSFIEANDVVVVDIETNYPDILALSAIHRHNASVFMRALRHGKALVMVRFHDDPYKSDYIMVSVGAPINPQNSVLHPGTDLTTEDDLGIMEMFEQYPVISTLVSIALFIATTCILGWCAVICVPYLPRARLAPRVSEFAELYPLDLSSPSRRRSNRFMEYLRDTINETPFYRPTARRRA